MEFSISHNNLITLYFSINHFHLNVVYFPIIMYDKNIIQIFFTNSHNVG